MDDTTEIPLSTPAPTHPPVPVLTPQEAAAAAEAERKQKQLIIVGSIIAVVVLLLIAFAVFVLIQPTTPTDKIRDIFIIFMALESLIIGAALVVMIVQIA